MVIRRLLIVISGGLALVAGAACTTAAPATPVAPAASSTSSASTAPAPAPHGASLAGRHRTTGNAAGSVTLAFAGDVNFAGRTRLLLADPATAFGPITAVLRLSRDTQDRSLSINEARLLFLTVESARSWSLRRRVDV